MYISIIIIIMGNSTIVPCYNCTGANTFHDYGFPMYGCDLCRNYGKGGGKLFKKYRHAEIVINGKTYIPPIYKCLECKDTEKIMYRFWDNRLIDSCSDRGSRSMPRVEITCKICNKKKHEKELKEAREHYEECIENKYIENMKDTYFSHYFPPASELEKIIGDNILSRLKLNI
jgi:hypothetical protein